MVVNFRVRGISRDTHKLVRTPTLIKNKKIKNKCSYSLSQKLPLEVKWASALLNLYFERPSLILCLCELILQGHHHNVSQFYFQHRSWGLSVVAANFWRGQMLKHVWQGFKSMMTIQKCFQLATDFGFCLEPVYVHVALTRVTWVLIGW